MLISKQKREKLGALGIHVFELSIIHDPHARFTEESLKMRKSSRAGEASSGILFDRLNERLMRISQLLGVCTGYVVHLNHLCLTRSWSCSLMLWREVETHPE